MTAATNPLLKMATANSTSIPAVGNNHQSMSIAAAAAARAYNMAAVAGANVLPAAATSYGFPAR